MKQFIDLRLDPKHRINTFGVIKVKLHLVSLHVLLPIFMLLLNLNPETVWDPANLWKHVADALRELRGQGPPDRIHWEGHLDAGARETGARFWAKVGFLKKQVYELKCWGQSI
jgi:hypothetical protein